MNEDIPQRPILRLKKPVEVKVDNRVDELKKHLQRYFGRVIRVQQEMIQLGF